MAIPTRADDERALEWIKLRVAGKTSSQIAARHGAREEWVRVVTNRVRAEDAKYSGTDVSAAYWSTVGGPKR